jgi:hypothetical protein
MKPYVLGIVGSDNFTKYFPEKSPYDNSAKSKEENVGK